MIKLNCNFIISLTIATCSSIGILSLQKNYSSNYLSVQQSTNYKKQEQQLKAEIALLKKTPSFGLNNLVADWAFLKYIQYFGNNEARNKVGYSLTTDYFETIVNKDPKFIQAHLYLSAGNSIFAGEPKKTIALLEKTTEHLNPNMSNHPFMIFAYKAVDEIIFFGDLKAAQQSYMKAAEWAEIRNDKTGDHVANLYRNTVDFLATNPDPSITQVSGWSMVLKRNNDPKIQKYAMQKIRELGGEVSITDNGQINIKPPKKGV